MKKLLDDVIHERDAIRNDLKRTESNKIAFQVCSAKTHSKLHTYMGDNEFMAL